MASDGELLRQYARGGSSEPFGELARRYLPLIYSAAMRQTRDPHLAEDVAQAVLIILSRKAAHVDPALLAGWLVRTTHFAARSALRQQNRRILHERKAAAMKPETQSPDTADPDSISAELDAALARLRAKDRTMVVLRFLQDKSFAEIAKRFQTTEGAVQRRVARAVQKLRDIFARRGVSISSAALPAALAGQALHAVPQAVLQSAGSIASLKGTTASLIAKGALMAMTKTKAAFAVIATIVMVGVAAPVVYLTANGQPTTLATTQTTQQTAPVAGQLPPGMEYQIVAVRYLPDSRWFDLGGKEITPPVDADKILSRVDVTYAKLELLTRSVVPPGIDYFREFVNGGVLAGTWGGLAYHINLLSPPADTKVITMVVNAATGPWSKMHVSAKADAASELKVNGQTLALDPPKQMNAHNVQLKEHGFLSHMDAVEVYGIDHAGNKVKPTAGPAMNVDGEKRITRTYTFDKPLSQFTEFVFRTRPFNYHATIGTIPVAAPATQANP